MKSQSSKNFIDHIAHKIPLSPEESDAAVEQEFDSAVNLNSMSTIQQIENQNQGLYNIIGTLVTNTKQKFCPILLEITNKDLLNYKEKEQVDNQLDEPSFPNE